MTKCCMLICFSSIEYICGVERCLQPILSSVTQVEAEASLIKNVFFPQEAFYFQPGRYFYEFHGQVIILHATYMKTGVAPLS